MSNRRVVHRLLEVLSSPMLIQEIGRTWHDGSRHCQLLAAGSDFVLLGVAVATELVLASDILADRGVCDSPWAFTTVVAHPNQDFGRLAAHDVLAKVSKSRVSCAQTSK